MWGESLSGLGWWCSSEYTKAEPEPLVCVAVSPEVSVSEIAASSTAKVSVLTSVKRIALDMLIVFSQGKWFWLSCSLWGPSAGRPDGDGGIRV